MSFKSPLKASGVDTSLATSLQQHSQSNLALLPFPDFSSKLLVKPSDPCPKGGDGCKSKDWRLEKLFGNVKAAHCPSCCLPITMHESDFQKSRSDRVTHKLPQVYTAWLLCVSSRHVKNRQGMKRSLWTVHFLSQPSAFIVQFWGWGQLIKILYHLIRKTVVLIANTIVNNLCCIISLSKLAIDGISVLQYSKS